MTHDPVVPHETGAAVPPFAFTLPGCHLDTLRIGQSDGIAVTLSGSLDATTILGLLKALELAGPEFVLLDESELKVGLIGSGDIQRIAHQWSVATRLRDAAIAVVAPKPVVYGLNRMFQLLSDAQTRFAVFRDRPAAVGWVTALFDPAH